MVVLEPETTPEGWGGYEGRTPIPTDVGGCDKVLLAGAIFENPRQDLRWKPVDRNSHVPDHSNRPQNLREITFDAIDLWIVRRLTIDHIGIQGYQTFCGCRSSNFLGSELSEGNDVTLYVHIPSE